MVPRNTTINIATTTTTTTTTEESKILCSSRAQSNRSLVWPSALYRYAIFATGPLERSSLHAASPKYSVALCFLSFPHPNLAHLGQIRSHFRDLDLLGKIDP